MPTPTSTPVYKVSGTIRELSSRAALAGATIRIGGQPPSSCIGWLGCGNPQEPSISATSAPDGSFAISGLAPNTYFMEVSLDPNQITGQTYAVLHQLVAVPFADLMIGEVSVSKLSTDESAWILKLNSERGTISFPATKPIVIDEFAQVQARAEAEAVASGAFPYGDATESIFVKRYAATSGVVNQGIAGGVAALTDTYSHAEDAYFAEKKNCPNGNWQTCTFAANTGHYLNLSTDTMFAVGLGESSMPMSVGAPCPGLYAFAGITAGFGSPARMAGAARIAAALPPAVR